MLRISLGYPTTLSSPPWRGRMASFGLGATFAPAAPAVGGFCLCAEYERQLGGGSPLSSLMVAKD